jgi:uncharacterized protein YyaL (SSP411 family)
MGCKAQSNKALENEILKAINEGAHYASTILLDKDGKSKCDYNVIEGKWYPYEIPWHTGQLIYGLVEAYSITQNQEYLTASKKAGDWWIGLEIRNHPVLNGMVKAFHGDDVGDIIVFATVSDGTAGLFKLYELTGNKRYADIPVNAGNWMLENMYDKENGVCYDAVDYKTGKVMKENSPFWPDKKEQTLYDLARPNTEGSLFKDMYLYTKNPIYKKAFLNLCNTLIKTQNADGLWMDFTPNDKEEGTIHPRFNLWYVESLLDAYDLTKDRKYLNAAITTMKKYTKLQKKDGTIYYKNYVDGSYKRGSVCGSAVSFAGILWLRLLDYGEDQQFKENLDLSLKWVLANRYASNHPDPNLAGAFINLRTRKKKGKIWMVNRDIGTSFGLRFLSKYYKYYYN